MEKESGQAILSLRNIYRMLTVKDYPTHSNGILREGHRKGLTLVSFWQETLIEEFRKGPTGKMIWRKEGGRNRFTSEICNRSLNTRFYQDYTEELMEQCRPDVFLNQVRRFSYFLKDRQFDSEAFGRKLPEFLTMLRREDSLFGEELFFLLNQDKGLEESTDLKGKTRFYFSYKLTILTLLALVGHEMGKAEVVGTLRDESLSRQRLWNMFLAEKVNEAVGIHHASNCHLVENVLPSDHFFGRERELFDLREMIKNGGKFLLRGIGGVGKTELVRQFIKMCRREKLVDEIVLVSYENNFLQSLEKAFNLYKTKDNNEEEAIARLMQLAQSNLLVVVDGVNKTEKEDTTLSNLKNLPGTIIVTGRINFLEGFLRCEIEPLDRKSGMLVFRDNCKRTLDKDELFLLEEMLKNPLFCHTLTLRLLGRFAGRGGLKRKFGEFSGRTEKEQAKALLKMYRKLYAMQDFTKEEEHFLKLLSLLPYRMYPLRFAKYFLKDVSGLVNLGWLMSSEEGVLLHPVIAESIRTDMPKAEDYEDFFSNVRDKMWKGCKSWAGDAFNRNSKLAWREVSLMAPMELFEDAGDIFQMVFQLGGGFSRDQQDTILMAYELLSDYANIRIVDDKRYLDIFEQMLEDCDNEEDAIRIKCGIADLLLDEDKFKECILDLEKLNGKNNEIANYYRIKLGLLLAHKGEFTESTDLLMQVHSKTKSRIFLIWVESNIEGILHRTGREYGDSFKDFDPTETAWKRVLEEGERFINGQLRTFLLFNLANHRLNQGRIEDAKEAFSLLESFLEYGDTKDLYLQGTIFYLKGTMLNREQDYVSACEYLEKAKELVGLYPMSKNLEAIFTEELAVAQDKAGRFQESEKSHLAALYVLENLPLEVEGAFRANANLASLYLAWDRPKEALERLERCVSYEEKESTLKNGPGHGVMLGHFAKAYFAMGELKKAVSYAEEAEENLVKFFGENHEKVNDMRSIKGECTKIGKL